MIFNTRKKYLQIAFNSSTWEALNMINNFPENDQFVIEIGTPLIKEKGMEAVRSIANAWRYHVGESAIIVADMKCMDRGSTEVAMAAQAGANALTCLGLAPLETIESFIVNCREYDVASMVDMLNVQFPFEILKDLKIKPDVVVLHRGVDEAETEVALPYYEISRIKGAYSNILVSLAGGETPKDIRRTFFNGADIAIVWKDFNNTSFSKELFSKYLENFKGYDGDK